MKDKAGDWDRIEKRTSVICELLVVEVSRNIFCVSPCSSIETSAWITWGPCIEKQGKEGGAAAARLFLLVLGRKRNLFVRGPLGAEK